MRERIAERPPRVAGLERRRDRCSAGDAPGRSPAARSTTPAGSSAHLPEASRLIMVKADGCVADPRRRRRLQAAQLDERPEPLVAADGAWIVTNPKGETLTITLEEVLSATRPTTWASTRACRRMASRPTSRSCSRPTRAPRARAAPGAPRVPDRHRPGRPALPRQRRRDRRHRGQAPRRDRRRRAAHPLLERLTATRSLRPVRGVFVAQQVKPQARVLAEPTAASRGVEVDYDELRGIEARDLRLF